MRALFVRLIETIRDGFSLYWLAPVIPLIALVPEMVQHIAEIRLGMFESKDVFRELAADPRRMVWGYLKIAGLLLSQLAALRFWATRKQGIAWYSPRGIRFQRLILACLLLAITAIPGYILVDQISASAVALINLAITIITLPLLTYLAGSLIGDPVMDLKHAAKHGWLPAIRIATFFAVTFIPLQLLHQANHTFAIGQSDLVVWALMIWDSIVVGAIAALMGTSIHHGYAVTGTGKNKGMVAPA